MKNKIIAVSTAVVIGCSTSVMAQDDLEGFFDGISGMATQEGAIISFSERNIGTDNSVEFRDLFITGPDGEIVIAADWLKAVPSATILGQVTFTLSPAATLTINDSAFPAPVVLNVANNGLVVTVDGLTSGQNAETLNYSVSANSLSINADSAGNPFLRALDLSFTDLAESFSITMATMLMESTGSIGEATYTYDFTTPEDDTMFGDGSFGDLEYALSFFAVDEDSFTGYMTGAMNAFFELSVGGSTGAAKMTNRDFDVAYSGSSEGASIEVRMQDGRFTLREAAGGAIYSFTKLNLDGMPIPPFDFTAGGAEIEVSLPFATGGELEETRIYVALADLAVSESLWSIGDPGRIIARDPINLVIDITANVKSNVDWNNPESALFSGNPMDIGEVSDVSINEIMLSAAGAKIAASGSAVIDNSMGIPFPTGAVNVTVNGIQTLANGLVELGLVPQEQIGMAMGMMMAFAKPGAVADEFVSEIEFSPQGVTANGTPLPF